MAMVDDQNLITESNEANNTLTTSLTVTAPPTPDLIVVSTTQSPVSPITGDVVTFSSVIKNQGGSATPAGVNHEVQWKVDGTPVSNTASDMVSMAAGEVRTKTAVTAWTATAGTHTILTTVDDLGLITEGNEANNTLTTSLTVAGLNLDGVADSTTRLAMTPAERTKLSNMSAEPYLIVMTANGAMLSPIVQLNSPVTVSLQSKSPGWAFPVDLE